MRPSEPTSVEVTGSGENWVVTVIEGETEFRQEFISEKHAAAYADGQRIRLQISELPDTRSSLARQ